MMTPALDSPPIPDHLKAALEASCGALVAMEVARAHLSRAKTDLRPITSETEQAIELVKNVISELHALRGRPRGPLSLGFVIPRKTVL